MMKKIIALLSLSVIYSTSLLALEEIDDAAMSSTVAQDGVDIRVNFEGSMDNLYFETKDGTDAYRFNMGGFKLDTDNTGNNPIDLTLDAAGIDERNGLVINISGVENLDLYADNIGVQKNAEAAQIFGTIGFENVSFNGGTAELSILAIPGDGDEGIRMDLSLPNGTTGNIILADESAKLFAEIEINDFSISQTTDVVDLDPGAGENLALKMIVNSMEGSFDIRQMRVVDSAGVTHRAGSYGRLTIDGMQINRGYTIVDSIQY